MSNQSYLPTQNVPFSQEAEEAVIGSVLVNPGMFPTVASFLKPDDFFLLRNNYIWEALLRLMERDEQIDYLTLIEELRAMNRLEGVGGEVYIIGLFRNTPTSVHAEAYGRLVERAAMRRRLIAAADEIRGLAINENMAIEEVVTNAESRLFNVTERQMKRDMLPIGEAIRKYYDRVEYLLQNQDEAHGVPTGFKDLDHLLGGLQKSDFIIFAGRPGMGKCISAGTLIPTEQGLVPIEALKPEGIEGIYDDEDGIYYPLEIYVQTPDGMRKTAYFYDSGVKPTLRMTTRAGYSLTGTYVHPVLVLSKVGEKVWKTLAELECGDFVAVQRHEAIWGNQNELPHFEFDFSRASYILKPTLPLTLTNDLAYILGVLAGDGNLTQPNYVSFTSADPEIVKLIYSWTESIGLHPIPRQNFDHQISSKVLNTWLKHIGLSGYAYEKEIPYTILQAPYEYVRAFLQGLFDTDGHAEVQRGYLQYVTTSEKLARQVHILLLQFGIVSKLTFKSNKYRGAWLIRITGDAARRFYDDIGFRLERKQSRRELLPETSNSNIDVIPYLPRIYSKFDKKSNFSRYSRGERSPSYNRLREIAAFAPEVTPLLDPEFYWDEITHIEHGGMQHCYDLTVPDGHAFIANGIVNHNTSFLLSVILNAARAGARTAIFTMEMSSEQIVQRIISMETGINMQKLRLGQMDAREWERFVESIGRLGNLNIFIDDTPAMNPIQLRTKTRRLQHEYGVDLVALDYLQLMNSGSSYENNRVQEISYISRNLKELAKELNVPILSAAQLSRAVEQRGDKRPILSDLRESGCVTGESLVYLPDNGQYVPIRELCGKVGFRVMSLNTATWKLEPAVVSKSWSTGVKPVYKMTTQLGRSIRATGNHKFLTIDGWKRLDEIASDEHIALPRVLPSPETQTMSDAELALLGHLIGDGCTLPTHAIQYTTREDDLAETVASLAKEVFGDAVRPRIHKEIGRSWYQVFIPPTAHLTHRVHNPVRVWLESLGVFGLRSYEKYVPEKVFQQPKEAIARFLRHIWATDGCIGIKKTTRSHYPAIYYASSSLRLAHDIQNLLLRVGVNARLARISQNGKGRDQFHVIVSGNADLERFSTIIGAVGNYKQQSTQLVTEYLQTHPANTNRDVIPHPVWRMYAVPAMQKNGVTTRQLQAGLGHAYCGTGLYKQNVGRERAARLAEVVSCEKIGALSQSDVYWDKIASIEADGETEVYDLTVPGNHNFVASNIIAHNSLEQDTDLVMFLYRDIVYNEATEFPNQADIIVAKHRNGPTGTISLYFEKSITKFLDAAVRNIDLSDL